MNLVNAGLNRVAVASREALRGEGGGEERRSWLVDHAVAPSFLQSLERGGHLLAGSIAARPKPQLAPPSAFEHRKLDPQLRDRPPRLPFLSPPAPQAHPPPLPPQPMSPHPPPL